MLKTNIVSFVVLILFSQTIVSQTKGFKLQVSSGLVVSQVDGDSYDGYTKFGEAIGIRSCFRFNAKTQLSTGIQYIQKGSKYVDTKYYSAYYLLRLHYVEVPVLFHYIFKKKYDFTGGLNYGYLFSGQEDNDGGGLRPPYPAMKKNELSFTAGLEYVLSTQWHVVGYYSYSITPIRPFPGNQTYWFNRGQYNNYLTFGLLYEWQ